MYKYIKRLSILVIVLNIVTTSFSQAKRQTKDTINTETVNVVKPYTPKISDAFKVKEIPSLDDDVTASKKAIKYNIFSIPVASIFTPAKAKAAQVDKAKKEKLFDNYASFGVGTFTSVLGEVYLNKEINRNESVGGYVNHHSSQGGVEDVFLDNDFSDTKLNINYARKSRDFAWNIDAGARHQSYNWYGLPENVFNETEIASIDPQHTFFTFDFGGELQFEDKLINSGSIRFRRFADNSDSGENRFVMKTNIDIPINRDESLNTNFKIDYIDGTFDRSFLALQEVNYGNFTANVNSSYQIIQDDLTVNLGASISYLNDSESGDNDFFIYPKITASYRLVDEILIAYGGVEGELIQNSYYDFANENLFVSPTLFIRPTDQQYNGYIGLKGKLSNTTSYNVRGNYYSENNKALFLANPALIGAVEDFQFGNSFGVVYDDITTFSVFGEINVDVNRNFSLGIKAEYFTYNTDDQEEAWNLPDFKASLFLDYQIDEHWFAGANLFYTGERFDQSFVTGPLINSVPVTTVLESFFDANAHLGYRINSQWSVYAKANNLANQEYDRWLNFPVQGIQFLAGTTYKFDF
ncbi:TonB-dependent receptor [Flavobacteriaceae bacterium AU392]|nr:TonB-dependent receptor [Flavobacteriaceae bacterium]RKM81655.1 TonB-dependent receptor [Flavobacteriaceae bacterium AU392]